MPIFSKVRMWWQVFLYNFGWPNYVWLLDGWLPKCSLAVPIIGYAILFNDTVAEHLSFKQLTSNHDFFIGLSSSARLKFFYLGLLSLGLGNFFYYVFRPRVMKIGQDQFEYVSKALEYFTASDYINIHGTIRTEGHVTLHGKYYDSEYQSFLDAAIGKKDDPEERRASNADWSRAKTKYEMLLRSMLIDNYFRYSVSRRRRLVVCIVISTIGYLLLAVPSIELFLRVMLVIFS